MNLEIKEKIKGIIESHIQHGVNNPGYTYFGKVKDVLK
ncbi:hypothetical protein J2S21_004510 [Peribacillus cavernae]|nr:hypothetical protein [Peribacillus cavernae]